MTERIPRRAPGYRLEQLDDELLLYHPGTTTALYLNQTATLIWQLCDGQRSDREIVQLVVEAFPEAGESIAPDVESTLRRLARERAIDFT